MEENEKIAQEGHGWEDGVRGVDVEIAHTVEGVVVALVVAVVKEVEAKERNVTEEVICLDAELQIEVPDCTTHEVTAKDQVDAKEEEEKDAGV